MSEKLFLCGFSTGGLLSLLKASNCRDIDGLICINAALSLQDIRVRYVVPTINVLNNFLSLFHADMSSYESQPEHPEINYAKHYLTSIEELKKLIDITKERLLHVTTPALIIQADSDPIVNPKSAQMILDAVNSEHKTLFMVESDKPVVVLQEGIKEKIADKIVQFIKHIKAYQK